MRQRGKGVEALCLAAQDLCEHPPGNVGKGNSVATAALRVVDVVANATHLRQA